MMKNQKLNELFDDVTTGIRNEKLDDTTVKAAAERVQTRLGHKQAAAQAGVATVEHLRGCDDFQGLIPAYLGGFLSSARTMLLEDHTRECVPCRKALKEARHGAKAQAAYKEATPKFNWFQMPAMKWALAAAVVLGFGVFAWPLVSQMLPGTALTATVEAASGPVYRVAENQTLALKAGEQLSRGERLRTAKEAGAVVKLSDGSLIETRERSEFAVNQTASGITINLERGAIIVQAAKQGGKKLYVATPDSLAAVTGTTFAVNSGTKGSRISVVEGEVQVDRAGQKTVLHPGEQLATHVSIAPVPVKDEVAWSRDADKYKQVLAAVKREIDAKVAMPGNRYSTRLLDLMPEGTVFYAAIPNLSQTLAQANNILQQNIETNPELRAWYDEQQTGKDGKKKHELGDVVAKLTEFGQFIGQEIAVGGEKDAVLALAEVKDPNGFRAFLQQQLANVEGGKEHVLLIDDPLAATAPAKQSKDGSKNEHLMIWLNNDVVVASTELTTLQTVAASAKGAVANRFNATPFHARLADVYREGAGLVIGADLGQLIGRELAQDTQRGGKDAAVLNQLGVNQMRHFIAELKDVNGQPQNRAVVTFDSANGAPQHGLASWLAAPGPMGALQFISPDANVVAAFVVQNPAAMYDDLMNTLKTADAAAWQEFINLQTQHGISLRDDFAAKLGGEIAVAVDGPVLPTPSWKVVCEVNDPAGLQQSFERAVVELNKELVAKDKPQLVWENAQSNGRTFYRLKPASGLGEVNYAYAYGFLIAAPSRALVENAIKYRESGYTLPQSAKFKAALPADKQANFSALVFYNVSSIVAPLAKRAGMIEGASKEHQNMLQKLAADKAGLAYVYSFGDRMVLSLNTEDGPVGLTPSSLLGMDGGVGLGQLFKGLSH
ncbi:MAG: FecR domain-containing protein [Acidobacteria bacterium]|nr:FecR domain-containing protein [Acidobacteriota bacterium]MBI3426136.1 FecR domain-containing protein [Acidobacteriota bacterium]